MKDALDIILFLKEKWNTRSTVSIFISLSVIGYIALLSPYVYIGGRTFNEIFTDINVLRNLTSILVIIDLFFVLFWSYSRKLPCVKKDQIGIAIAIVTNNRKDKIKIKRDFIDAICAELHKNGKYSLVDLSEYYVNQFMYNTKKVLKIHNKTKCPLIIFGGIETRTSNGVDCYHINVNASLKHNPITVDIHDAIAKEMRIVLPENQLIPLRNEFEGFQFTVKLYSIVARYILGVGAYYSEKYEEVVSIINSIIFNPVIFSKTDLDFPVYKFIVAKSKKYVLNSGLRVAAKYLNDKKKYDKVEFYLDIVHRIDSKNYDYAIQLAILYFSSKRRVDDAINILESLEKNKNDFTWAYNLAFLYAYKGEMQKAYHLYEIAFSWKDTILACQQCIDFMMDIYRIESEKIQMLYFLGLILHKKKSDHVLAKEMFNEFIVQSKQYNIFTEYIGFSEMYVRKCDEKNLTIAST